MLTEEERLIEKLRKIEALFARPSTEGERAAAKSARDRIRGRLEQLGATEPVEEFRFSMPDTWSRSLFLALLRRHGLRPFRYTGQRRTTVMVRATRSFVKETLEPEFRSLNETLRRHLGEVTRRMIAQGIHQDSSEAEVRSEHGGR
jgi:hypothetical protein